MPNSPCSRYRKLIEECQISHDAAQERVIIALQELYDSLAMPDMLTTQEMSLWQRLSDRIGGGGTRKRPSKWVGGIFQKRGIYLWGGVGRGKSMLMDIFYQALPFTQKRRVHFHEFMQEVHAAMHRHRKEEVDDPLIQIAHDLSTAYRVLCFDELHVHDIADAMILTRLFNVLCAAGVVVVFTSNRPPQDLYLHGLQRERFLPFIAWVTNALRVMEIESPYDYRQGRLEAIQHRYLTPDNEVARQQLTQYFNQMIGYHMAKPATITVQGRTLTVSRAHHSVAWMSFNECCDVALGANDYLVLAQRFRVLFIEGIPRLTSQDRNQAKRFVTLIDVLYEARVVLFCTAQEVPEGLYPAGDGTFEFNRTASRLREMMAENYLLRKSM